MYFVKSGSGFAVYPSFLGKGPYESWGPASCTRTLCPDLFRSFLIDVWFDLPLKKVKLSLYKNSVEVAFMIFDGQGTNSRDWFSMSRVLDSSWKDVYRGAKNIHFSLYWRWSMRTFYAAKSHSGCRGDIGWIIVIGQKIICAWEKHFSYPYIIYSNKTEGMQWNAGRAFADSLAVYISF